MIINDTEICATADSTLALRLPYAPDEVVVYIKTKTTHENRVLKVILFVLAELEKKMVSITAAGLP